MDKFATNGGASANGLAASERCRHGQAALLLTESLMHALVEKGLLTREEFIGIVDSAAEVELELTSEKASSPRDSNGSLLHPLAVAFRQEVSR